MKAKPFGLCERTYQFADELLDWIEKCPRTFMTLELLRQLIRAGTSVGANTEEGEEGQSPKDEAPKLGIALKEVCESRYFLRLLKKRAGPQNNPDDFILEPNGRGQKEKASREDAENPQSFSEGKF